MAAGTSLTALQPSAECRAPSQERIDLPLSPHRVAFVRVTLRRRGPTAHAGKATRSYAKLRCADAGATEVNGNHIDRARG